MLAFSDMYVAGFLPELLSVNDPRPAAKQLQETYAHGGGWRPMKGWIVRNPMSDAPVIEYPGDPAMSPVSEARLRDEKLFLYDYSWLLIIQSDGSYEIARVD